MLKIRAIQEYAHSSRNTDKKQFTVFGSSYAKADRNEQYSKQLSECRADASKIPMTCRFLALSCKRSRASSGFRWWKEEKSVLNPLRCPGILVASTESRMK